MDLSDRIARYVMKIPPAIEGQNGSGVTFYLACQLVNGFGLDESEALHWLKQYNAVCQPEWSDKELLHKVRSAAKANHKKARGHLAGGNGTFEKSDLAIPPRPLEPKPKIDPATAMEVWLNGFRCSEEDLCEVSPIKPSDDFTHDGVALISHLFKAGEIVNFVTDYKMVTRKTDGKVKANPGSCGASVERDSLIEKWSSNGMPKSDAGGWIRMNPVDGEGVDDANVTAFRFVLLEWDGIPLELQMAFLARAPLPIAVILTSGGASLHAWVKVDAPDREAYEAEFLKLRDVLLNFGMDRKNKNPSRLSRLVGVTRKVGANCDGRQRIIYLNPAPEQKAIL